MVWVVERDEMPTHFHTFSYSGKNGIFFGDLCFSVDFAFFIPNPLLVFSCIAIVCGVPLWEWDKGGVTRNLSFPLANFSGCCGVVW